MEAKMGSKKKKTKMMSTRKGNYILLEDLLNLAIQKAKCIIDEKEKERRKEMGMRERILKKIQMDALGPKDLCTIEEVDQFEAIKDNDVEKIKRLINQGADVNVKDHNGISLFHMISLLKYKNFDTIAKFLISAGIDVDATDINGETPLIWAINYENKDFADFLISVGANVNMKNRYGETATEIYTKRWKEINKS